MPYKVHRVYEKPAGTQWNSENYTEEDKQIFEDYVANVVNVQPGYKGEVVKTFENENKMKLTYTLYNETAAKSFVRAITNIGNEYFHRFHNIERHTVEYRIESFLEDEDGNIERIGFVINPDLTQT